MVTLTAEAARLDALLLRVLAIAEGKEKCINDAVDKVLRRDVRGADWARLVYLRNRLRSKAKYRIRTALRKGGVRPPLVLT